MMSAHPNEIERVELPSCNQLVIGDLPASAIEARNEVQAKKCGA
jgi:hypothetical protein